MRQAGINQFTNFAGKERVAQSTFTYSTQIELPQILPFPDMGNGTSCLIYHKTYLKYTYNILPWPSYLQKIAASKNITVMGRMLLSQSQVSVAISSTIAMSYLPSLPTKPTTY